MGVPPSEPVYSHFNPIVPPLVTIALFVKFGGSGTS